MVKTRKYKKRKKSLKGGLFGFGKKKNVNTSRKETIKKKCGRGHMTTGNAKKVYEQLIKLKKDKKKLDKR